MKTAYSPQQLKSRVGTWFSPCVWRCVSRNMSQTRSYSSRADMRDRFFQRDRGRCTFGIVARPRLRPMASWPTGATGHVDGSVFRLREATDRRLHRVLDLGPPIPRSLLPGDPAGPGGWSVHPGSGLPRLPPLHAADEATAAGTPGGGATRETNAAGVPDATDGSHACPANGTGAASPAATTAPADGRPLATRFPIFLAVRRPKRPFLPLPAVLLLLLEPREQPGRRTERPELEDDLAMFLVLRHQEHPSTLRDDIDRLLERNLVVALPFLAAGKIEPFHIEEEGSSAGLPHPSFALLDERLLCEGHGLEDDVRAGAVPDDLVAAMEDGLVRFGEDGAALPDLIDLHPGRPTSRAG